MAGIRHANNDDDDDDDDSNGPMTTSRVVTSKGRVDYDGHVKGRVCNDKAGSDGHVGLDQCEIQEQRNREASTWC